MRNRIFEKIPHVIPDRSGFDLSHENTGTAKPGILVPVMVRRMTGNDSLSVNLGHQIQFAPFATDFYGRVKVYFEAFFVPYRVIDGSWKRKYRIAGAHDGSSEAAVNPYFEGIIVDPAHTYTGVESADLSVGPLGAGSLLDYLGLKGIKIVGTQAGMTLKLPNRHFLDAYHFIYETYYRDPRVQLGVYHQYSSGSLTQDQLRYTIPYRDTPSNSGNQYFLTDGILGDGCYLTGLRARNYAKDYFTMATPKPQFGDEISVQADANGKISISQIRTGSALQQFAEIYNRIGIRYDDVAFALTGIRPSDAAVDIPVYLGRIVADVYNKSVYSSNTPSASNWDSVHADSSKFPNPFISVGTKYGNGQSLGSGHLCDFTATEGGIFMVLMSVAPDASYSSGKRRDWFVERVLDLPFAQLAGIGDQPVYQDELSNEVHTDSTNTYVELLKRTDVFGYTQRFAEYKFMLDETHGLLREGEQLESFSLKRYFNTAGQISSSFIKVPTNCLDEVSAIKKNNSGSAANPQSSFGYWYDLYFDVKLVSTLPAYSLPTLENMKGKTVMVDNGGRRF